MRNTEFLFDLRALAALGVAFIVILVLQNYESQLRLSDQMSLQRKEVVGRAERVVNSIFAERTEQLIGFTEMLAATKSIASFMQNPGAPNSGLSDLLSQLTINAEAQRVFFFDPQGIELLRETPESSFASMLATESVGNGRPKSLVVCKEDTCFHYVSVPLLLRGKKAGAIVVSYGLDATFQSFERASGAKITVRQCHNKPNREVSGGRLEIEFGDNGVNLPPGYCYRALFDVSKEKRAIENLVGQGIIVSILGSILLVIILLGFYIVKMRSHKRIIQAESDARLKKTEALDRASRSFENERRVLAAELHDELGQRLVPIRFNVTILRSLASEKEGCDEIVEIADVIEDGIESLSKGVSSLLNSLRPPLLDTLGLRGSIESIVNEFRVAMPSCDIQFNSDERLDLESINDPTQVTIYRTVQEGLTNISKHAPQSTRASIGIFCTPHGLHLAIRDNGPGIDKDEGSKDAGGFGLRGMKERAYAMNGRLVIQSELGQGTEISLELPCDKPICNKPCHKHGGTC